MIAPAVSLHLALGSPDIAGADPWTTGKAVVTRLDQPFCADPNDLRSYFIAAIASDEVAPSAVGSCSPLHARHTAIITKVMPGRRIVRVKVYVGQRAVAGYMAQGGVRAP